MVDIAVDADFDGGGAPGGPDGGGSAEGACAGLCGGELDNGVAGHCVASWPPPPHAAAVESSGDTGSLMPPEALWNKASGDAASAACSDAAAGTGVEALPGFGKPSSLWRNRDYAGWWIGTAVSSYGSRLSGIAFPLLMLYQSGSVAAAGVIAACDGLGALATTLLGGVLADRVSRRLLLTAAPLLQSLALAAVAALVADGSVAVPVLAALAAASGLASGLALGCVQPTLKRIVAPGQYPAATAASRGRDMITGLLGPASAGVLFTVARWIPFLGDAASFLAAAAGAAAIRAPLGPDERTEACPHEPRVPLHRQLGEGVRYIRSVPFLRFLTVWAPAVNLGYGALGLLVIVMVRHRGGSPATVGLVASLTAVGGIAGAVAAPWLIRRLPGRVIVLSATWCIAAGTFAAAFIPSVWGLGGAMGLVMVLMVPINTVLDAYEARIVPDALLGRVSSSVNFLCSGLLWAGPLAAGLLAGGVGAVGAFVVCGAAFAAAAVWCQCARPLHLLDAA